MFIEHSNAEYHDIKITVVTDLLIIFPSIHSTNQAYIPERLENRSKTYYIHMDSPSSLVNTKFPN